MIYFRYIAIVFLSYWTLPAWGTAMLIDWEARLEVERGVGRDRETHVHFLSGGPFGPGAIGGGLVDLNNAGAAPPDDTLWLVQSLAGLAPPDDNRILTFTFDDLGNYLGIEPTPFYDPNVVAGVTPDPFRIFVGTAPPDDITPADLLGELDFREVSGVTIGSLNNITGLQLVKLTDGGPDITFEPFSIHNVPEPTTMALLGLGLARISHQVCAGSL